MTPTLTPVQLLEALGRFNAAHPWSHNDAFAVFVLRHARAVRRRGGTTALDVGCGTGNLVARLAAVFPHVVGLEPDAPTARIAAARFPDSNAVQIVPRPFTEHTGRVDLVVLVASLHHMPLRETLERVRATVAPGGRMVIVGVARDDGGIAETARSLISLVLNPVVGLVRHPRRASGPPLAMRAPTAEPAETVAQIRAVARAVMPGVRVRRRLFWRYTATWVAPG